MNNKSEILNSTKNIVSKAKSIGSQNQFTKHFATYGDLITAALKFMFSSLDYEAFQDGISVLKDNGSPEGGSDLKKETELAGATYDDLKECRKELLKLI